MGSKPSRPKLLHSQSAPVLAAKKITPNERHSTGQKDGNGELKATENDMLLIHEVWKDFLQSHKNDIAATAFLRLFMSRPQLKRIFRLSVVPAGDLINHELFQSHMSRFALFLDTLFGFLEGGKSDENLKALMVYVDNLGRSHAHIGKAVQNENDKAAVFDPAYWQLFAENLLDIVKEMLADKDFTPLKYYKSESPEVVLGKLSGILGFVIAEMRKSLSTEAALLAQK